MKYSCHTFGDSNFIKAFVHQQRLKIALQLVDLNENDHFLDFGAGDGTFAKYISKSISNITLYEPSDSMFKQLRENCQSGFKLVNNINNLNCCGFDKISCLEVLEHLTDGELHETLIVLSKLLNEKGKLVISVPIETGISGLLKNVFRLIHAPQNEKLSLMRAIKLFLKLEVKRDPAYMLGNLKYIYSHVGFDYRAFKKTLQNYFIIEKQRASPFPLLGSVLNHTIYFVCSKRATV